MPKERLPAFGDLAGAIGRAARNVEGKALRRRGHRLDSSGRSGKRNCREPLKQQAYNEANGITPASIRRGIQDILGSGHEADHVTVDIGLADGPAIGHNLQATIAELEKRMKEAAGSSNSRRRRACATRSSACNARARGRRRPVRQEEIEAEAGAYAWPCLFGRAAYLPSTGPRKPTNADMGPHNWGGGGKAAEGRGKMRRRRG